MQKKSLCTLLLLACFVLGMLVFPVAAATDGAQVGTWKWSFDSSTATLTISGTGTVEGYPSGSTEGYMKYVEDVRHLVIDEGITEIGQDSFAKTLYYLESIRIADSVENIGKNAFANNFRVTQIHLGKGIKTIGEAAFTTSEKVETLVLPAGVQSIGVEAFSLCGMKELVIPEGVTVIEGSAFRACGNLTRVYIPAGVTQIKYAAFRDCDKLTDVYFGGTEAQWKAVDIDQTMDGKGGSNSALLNAKMHYSHTHAWDEGNVITAPGCEKEGEKTCTCTQCGAVTTQKVAVQHTWDGGTKNADTTVTYKCVNCTATKTEGTPAQPEEENASTAATEQTKDEPANTPADNATDNPSNAPTENSTADDETEESAPFPWVAVCIGAAVLLSAVGVVVWLCVKKRA